MDRRKLLWIMNDWLSVAAGLLAIFASLGVLNPYIILICIFLTGIGFAFKRSRLDGDRAGTSVR